MCKQGDAMTEPEWLACTDPTPMLEFLRGKASERKLRLFAVACCRRAWQALQAGDERACSVVEVAERYADGRPGGLLEVWAALSAPRKGRRGRPRRESLEAMDSVHGLGEESAWNAAMQVSAGVRALVSLDVVGAEQRAQAALMRDLFGNPFRPSPSLPPTVLAWNDGTVRRIAESIYEERAFGRLPVLADALLDAGCDDEELMQHCRSPEPHVRGCWAVDLILGKG
jgi:hypothetical protein